MKAKKIICVLLSLILTLSVLSVSAGAKSRLPESKHPYKNDTVESVSYSFPEGKGFLTFSEDTYFEEGGIYITFTDGTSGVYTLDELIGDETGFGIDLDKVDEFEIKTGDYLAIQSDNYYGEFSGNTLAGQTIYIPDGTVTLTLVTDETGTAYGYKVTSASASAPKGVYLATFHFGEDSVSVCGKKGAMIDVPDLTCSMDGAKAAIGWQSASGKTKTDSSVQYKITKDIDFYPVYTDLLLDNEEVYSFNNDMDSLGINNLRLEVFGNTIIDTAFNYMNNADYRALLINGLRAGKNYEDFGAALLETLVMLYENVPIRSTEVMGACFGMSLTTALQHYGFVDLTEDTNAENLAELEPTPELISILNYYQGIRMTMTSWDNLVIPGMNETEELTYEQLFASVAEGDLSAYDLEDVYNAVASGKIVLLNFIFNDLFTVAGHAVLVTGAYTNKAGEHILVLYDCNFGSEYANGTSCQYIVCFGDYSSAYSPLYGDIIYYMWMSDFSGLDDIIYTGGGPDTFLNSFLLRIEAFFDMIRDFFEMIFGFMTVSYL